MSTGLKVLFIFPRRYETAVVVSILSRVILSSEHENYIFVIKPERTNEEERIARSTENSRASKK